MKKNHVFLVFVVVCGFVLVPRGWMLYRTWQMGLIPEFVFAIIMTFVMMLLPLMAWLLLRALNKTDEQNAVLQRQAEIFQVMHDAVIYGTSDLKILGINAAAARLLEVSEEDVKGKNLDEALQIELDGVDRVDARKQVFSTVGIWRGQGVITSYKARRVNVIATLKSVRDRRGEIVGWFGVYTDITTLKTAEQRLSYALDGMQAGLWEWNFDNPSGNWWSPRFAELLGYVAGEITPSEEAFLSFLHPSDVERTLTLFRQKTRDDERFETELRYRTRQGDYKWFLVVGRPKLDYKGQPVSLIGSIIDIDEKHRAQLMVQQQAALIQIIPDGIFYGTEDDRIINVNKEAEQMIGLPAEKIIGKKLDDLLKIEIIGKTEKQAQEELQQKGFTRNEIKFTTTAGKEMIVLATVKTLENVYGEGPGWVCLYTDIEPLRLNTELKTALRVKEENNRYLEQLAYIGTHDLKSPIVTVAGLLDLLAKPHNENGNSEHIMEMLRQSVAQMQRTNRALNDILSLRKSLVSTKDTAADGLASINEIISDLKITVEKSLKDIEGTLDVQTDGTGNLKVPYVHFRSVLYNLTSNSIKYAAPARKLHAHVHIVKDDTGGLMISVSDNGLGMDLESNPGKIFGIFKRMHNHVEGSGVGLHIVKSIVDAYGGTIDVQSREEQGSSFKIKFGKNTVDAWN